MHLGIEKHSGTVFYGLNGPELPAQPQPMISQCALIKSEGDWKSMPPGLVNDPNRWVFREDSFDPVTRIRRGRVYQPYGNSQPQTFAVSRDPSPDSLGKAPYPTTHTNVSMYRYMACTELLHTPNKAFGMPFVVGSGAGTARYTIVQLESLLTGDVMVTLKEQSPLGVIPDLKESAVPETSRKPVRQALERAVNSAFRETAVSVVDQCRNAMATVLSHYLAAEMPEKASAMLKAELAHLATTLMERQMAVCSSAAVIVARLHSRGKSNEQISKGLKEPGDEEAQFAVHALGLVMREIGWAR